MNGSRTAEQVDSTTLRLGGLAGILGSILMLVTFGVVAFFVGMEPLSAAEALDRYPDDRTAHVVENSLYLLVLLLWMVHLLALHRALARTNPAPALFGTALGIVGLVMLAAGALPHIATDPIAERFHASGATAQDQTTLVLLWEATYGILDALLVTGLTVVPFGVLVLARAMRGAPGFGAGIRRTTVALGTAGLAAAVALLVGAAEMAVISVLALVVLHLVLGRRVHALAARTPRAEVLVDA